MPKITILGTKPKAQLFPVVSWGIRLLEHSPQSHVAFYFENEGIIRHAHFNNIKEINYNDFIKTNSIVNIKTIELTDKQYLKLQNYTKSKLGKQTGYFSTLFGELIPLIVRQITGHKFRNLFVKGLLCSEFVRAGLREVDEVFVFLLTHDIPNGTFTTTDALYLAEELSKISNN